MPRARTPVPISFGSNMRMRERLSRVARARKGVALGISERFFPGYG
jgi:hypothetical protein